MKKKFKYIEAGNRGWMVSHKNGSLLTLTASYTRSDSIARCVKKYGAFFIHSYAQDPWREMRRDGFKCVKVKFIERG